MAPHISATPLMRNLVRRALPQVSMSPRSGRNKPLRAYLGRPSLVMKARLSAVTAPELEPPTKIMEVSMP